jgi:hypothetical protein
MKKSRGLRNNNPGNIRRTTTRYRGEVESRDAAFKCFESMPMGYRAMFVLLHTYRVKYGLRTIAEMVARYAPSSENDTQAYIEAVGRISGVGTTEPLDTTEPQMMMPVVSAMSRVENGVCAVPAEVMAGWDLFAEDYSSSSSSSK